MSPRSDSPPRCGARSWQPSNRYSAQDSRSWSPTETSISSSSSPTVGISSNSAAWSEVAAQTSAPHNRRSWTCTLAGPIPQPARLRQAAMADALIAILVSAVVLGSLYALLASGLSIVWSTLGVFNYAQGGILIAAGYLIWTLAGPLGVPVLLAFILAVPLVALLGVVLELVAVRPLVHRANGTLLVMVSTLAVASAMGGAMQLIWGPTNRQLPAVSTETVSIGGTQVAVTSLLALALALSLVIGLIQLLNRTEWGAGIRAVAQNRDMALLMGIKPSRVYATVFGIAAVLACAAALIYGTTSTLTPTKGFEPLLTAFVVLVFGGSATLWGTLLGAFVIGLLEAATSFALGLQWSPVIVFVVLVAVLLIRPQGLVKGRTA
ncbi:hypothetical protein C5C17_15855 [Pseudoclavibacter sp. RFBA6]|nr:hypothetical protein C5C17_15855 [Pseudoclavibacter sp. RFBA6]